jgi:hypothetical protein
MRQMHGVEKEHKLVGQIPSKPPPFPPIQRRVGGEDRLFSVHLPAIFVKKLSVLWQNIRFSAVYRQYRLILRTEMWNISKTEAV